MDAKYSFEYLEAYSGGRLVAVAALFIVLDLLFVALREVARYLTKATWGWDDYFLVPALVTNLGVCIHGIGISWVAIRPWRTLLMKLQSWFMSQE